MTIEDTMFEKNTTESSSKLGNQNNDDLFGDDNLSQDRFGVEYACLKCGIITSGVEISRLPEIKCICGFKVFTKVRPPTIKTVRAI